MKELQDRLEYLLNKYGNSTLLKSEENELFTLIDEAKNDSHIKSLLLNMLQMQEPDNELNKEQWEPILRKIVGHTENEHTGDAEVYKLRGRKRFMKWKMVAASLFVILSGALVFYFIQLQGNNKKESLAIESPAVQDITPPSSVNAFLTLANGQKITLDSVSNGTLAQQGAVKVIKLSDGKIAYHQDASDNIAESEIMYNTLTNPAGSMVVNITLEDGTRVWLNAKSSLRYPTVFTGKERKVEISGEAYFEVAHLSLPHSGKGEVAMPFRVNVRGVDVKVLGTHFNINGYDDEAVVKTTLLEGSVKITTDSYSKMIKPGEQAQVPSTNQSINIITPDLNEVMAWKNGRFSYSNSDLGTIMRQMARWYNVEVVYQDKISDRYTVNVSDNVPVSQLFKFIEMSGGVHFEIVGKKILVKK